MKDFSIFLALILALFVGITALGFSVYMVFIGHTAWSLVLFTTAVVSSVLSLRGLSKVI